MRCLNKPILSGIGVSHKTSSFDFQGVAMWFLESSDFFQQCGQSLIVKCCIDV